MVINFLCLKDNTHIIRFQSSFARPVTSDRSQGFGLHRAKISMTVGSSSSRRVDPGVEGLLAAEVINEYDVDGMRNLKLGV